MTRKNPNNAHAHLAKNIEILKTMLLSIAFFEAYVYNYILNNKFGFDFILN